MPELVACGYNPFCYISSAKLVVYPYTTKGAIIARLTGEINDLIPSTDDNNTGNTDATIFNSVLSNVTLDINGLISSIYPIPLAKMGTVSILRVKTVSSDGNGTVTTVQVLDAGGYVVAPQTTNSPAYLRFSDQLAYQDCWGWNFNPQTQLGTGLSLTVAYTAPSSVTPQTPIQVNGTPVIASGGTGYVVNDLVVLTGGSSFVPDKIQNAASLLMCYELRRRRLVPDEKNVYYRDTKMVKDDLLAIGHGEMEMDGTYRRFYSPVASWSQTSVLNANSL